MSAHRHDESCWVPYHTAPICGEGDEDRSLYDTAISAVMKRDKKIRALEAELADLRASSVVVREVPRSELQPGDVYADHISRQEDDNKRTMFVRHVDSVWLIEGGA